MQNAARAIVHDGQIRLVDEIDLPEGAHLIVTLVEDDSDDRAFWIAATQTSLDKIWNNSADDVYEELL
jgi:hypothetical protein